MNEFAIEWTKDRDYAGVTVPSGNRTEKQTDAVCAGKAGRSETDG